jgi:ATP-dependent DNA helicase RecQ
MSEEQDIQMVAGEEGLPADPVIAALEAYWGYSTLRPVQREAMECALGRRDSLVVMPTGGGKSLCYQVPPLLTGRLTVVVSPLIALMKDQVDSLKLIGYPAGALYSGQSSESYNETLSALARNELRLLYVAPERLMGAGFLSKLVGIHGGAGPWSFAIDEAHCISQWGHDFRPEYRRMKELREAFPRAVFNAFTATATQRVREDIAAQLGLRNPKVMVGRFDRPNLTYRIVPKVSMLEQVKQCVKRHTDGATIVYAISRRTTEEIAGYLTRSGIDARAYHAGLGANERTSVQEAFAQEEINVVVATVAFGMGIDRGNVRCVVHAELPKSIENYQQETGRAGRDGLKSECVLLYSAGDAVRWQQVLENGGSESGATPQSIARQKEFVEEMRRFAASAKCRHKFLSEYFGQKYEGPGEEFIAAHGDETGQVQGLCGACDVCLGELEAMPDSTVIAQKVLSCIARVAQASPDRSFGANHIVGILRGSHAKAIRENGHEALSTFGILANLGQLQIASCINQLQDLGYIARASGDYPTVSLTKDAWAVLRGQVEVALATPKDPVITSSEAETRFDEGCFEMLRGLRVELARARQVAAYIIFSDDSLQHMAAMRPVDIEHFAMIRGVGKRRLEEFGEVFCGAIGSYAQTKGLAVNVVSEGDVTGATRRSLARKPSPPAQGRKAEAFVMFDQKMNVADVAVKLGVTTGTVMGYLCDYVDLFRPGSISTWVDAHAYARVKDAGEELQTKRLKPVFEKLNGEVSYDQIRLVLAHVRGVG